LLLFLSIFKIGASLYALFTTYYSAQNNPLIPKYLVNYVAFPQYFLIPLWLAVFIMSWRLIRNETKLNTWFLHFFIGTLCFLFSEYWIYSLLMAVNPYSG